MYPSWFSTKGYKVAVAYCDLRRGKLTLASGAARLRIRLHPHSADESREWLVNWNVSISAQTEWTGGQRVFADIHLQCAFGLKNRLIGSDPDDEHMAMAEQFKADVAWPGLYIRKGRFLNVPDPGTGFYPQSSISIEISEDMRDMVAKLLAQP